MSEPQQPQFGIFIGSGIDDVGLDPYEFRVYARISRRGNCTESIANIARSTLMGVARCRQAIHSLEKKGLISRAIVTGKGSVMKMIPLSSKMAGALTEEFAQSQAMTPIESDRGITSDRGIESDRTPLSDQTGAPLSDSIGKGTPIKVLPKGTMVDSSKSTGSRNEYSDQFEEFWEEVPNKIGKQNAFIEFKKALKRASFEEIMAGIPLYRRVEAERSLDPGSQKHHPERWLKGSRWEDEDEPPAKPTPKRPKIG